MNEADAYIWAVGLSLGTLHSPVFSDVSFSVRKGSLAVVTGPSGSGRSALLLAVAGRMRGVTGELRVAGFDALAQSRKVRAATSLARVSTLVTLEGQLTVGDSITERALTDGLPARRSVGVFDHAEPILDTRFDRRLLVDDLTALDRTLLAVALASMRPAHILVLDDADAQLDLADGKRLMSALRRVTDTGITVLASTLADDVVPADAQVIALSPRP